MRSAAVDRRLISPPASQWQLTGGAYRDGDEIVLPDVGANASLWIHAAGTISAITWRPTVYIPAGGDNVRYAQMRYRDPSRSIDTRPRGVQVAMPSP